MTLHAGACLLKLAHQKNLQACVEAGGSSGMLLGTAHRVHQPAEVLLVQAGVVQHRQRVHPPVPAQACNPAFLDQALYCARAAAL